MKKVRLFFLIIVHIILFGTFANHSLWAWSFSVANPQDYYCGIYSFEKSDPNYVEWFYSGYLNSSSIQAVNFCLGWWGVYPTNSLVVTYPSYLQQAKIVWNERNRSCYQNTILDSKWYSRCTAKILPPEVSECLQQDIARDTKPTHTMLNPLCKKADAHGLVDPWEPTVSNISGWNYTNQPRTWTCGWKYYTKVDCKAPSKWKCIDTANKLYDDLISAPELCLNGQINWFTLDTWTYLYKRTCKWSESQYDANCSAQKTTTKWECHYDYNNRYFDELGTGNGETLCKYWILKDFRQEITNVDNQFGRYWTCAWSIPNLNVQCFAHKNIVKWICDNIISNTPQENLTLSMWLCSSWIGTWITMDMTWWNRNRTCAGTRSPKDDTKCTTKIKITQAKCGVKNWQPCETLDQTSNELCEIWNMIDWSFDEVLQKRSWKCVWAPSQFSVQCSAYKSIAGKCNEQLHTKTMKYEDIVKYPLCSIGSTNTILNQLTTWWTRKRDCVWPNSWAVSSCYVNQISNGQCASLIWKVRTLPDNMCISGIPISTKVVNWNFVWTCQWFNGGSNMQCSIACEDSNCILPEQNTWNIVDWIPPDLWIWDMCNDVDWCMCGKNKIFNGAICQAGEPRSTDPNDPKNPNYMMPIFRPQLENRWNLYDESMMLPGDADLVITQKVNTWVAKKHDNLIFEIYYENMWPDTAFGTYIAYKYSDMLTWLSASKPRTKITVLTWNTVNTWNINTWNTQTADNIQTGVSITWFSNYPYYLVIWTWNSWAILSWTQIFTNIMISGYVNNCACAGTWCECVVVTDWTSSQATWWSINANNTSSLNSGSNSNVTANSDIYQNVIFFYIWTMEPWQTGKLVISGTVIASLRSDTILNIAQINSRVKDPDKTNNISSISVLVKWVFTTALHLINPLIPIKNTIDNRKSIIDRAGSTKSFRDVIVWHPRYMHIMTVQKNWIMKWYEYKYSTVFLPKRCVSRLEYILVMWRTMQFANNNYSVLSSPYDKSPFKDVISKNPSNIKYVNRAYSVWITDVRKAGKSMQDILGADKPVQHKEAKEAIYRLYRLMNYDTNHLNSLFVWWTTGSLTTWSNISCLTREETAYSIAHLLRWNPNIVMWFNDIFIWKFYEILLPMSVSKRRDAIARVVAKLRFLPATMLYKLGLDNETLMWVLADSLKWKEYKSDYNASSSNSFFNQLADDEYDQYLLDR